MELFKSEGKEKVEYTDAEICCFVESRWNRVNISRRRCERGELWSAC